MSGDTARLRPTHGRDEWAKDYNRTQDGRNLLARYDREERYGASLSEQAETMVVGLKPGPNEFGKRDFQILVRYLLLDQDRALSTAMHRGQLVMGPIEIVRCRLKSQSKAVREPKTPGDASK